MVDDAVCVLLPDEPPPLTPRRHALCSGSCSVFVSST